VVGAIRGPGDNRGKVAEAEMALRNGSFGRLSPGNTRVFEHDDEDGSEE
jgi:hypothetical protein